MHHFSVFHKKGKISIGIDISDATLKGVALETRKNLTLIKAAHSQEIPKDAIVKGGIKKPKIVGELIEELSQSLQGGRIHQPMVVVPLPEPETYLSTFTIPPPKELTRAALSPKVKEEMKAYIPIPPEQLTYDWQITQTNTNAITVAVGAAPRVVITQYTKLFSNQHLIPKAFEIESIAIARALLPFKLPKKESSVIVVDLGANRSGMSLVLNNTVQLAVSAPISGNTITDQLSVALKKSPQEIEALRKTHGFHPEKSIPAAYKTILLNMGHDLLSRIEEIEKYYQSHWQSKTPLSKIILTGGGSKLTGIADYLTKEQKIKVELGDPLTNIHHSLSHPCPIPPHERPHYTTAIGLALRNVMPLPKKLL